jgi:signal transduction histidine kinase/ActR/RegA family two-component response regulator
MGLPDGVCPAADSGNVASLLELIPAGIVICRIQHRKKYFTAINATARTMLGSLLKADSTRYLAYFRKCLHPDDAVSVMEKLKMTAYPGRRSTLSYYYRTGKTEYRKYRQEVNAVPLSDGALLMISVYQDITGEAAAKKELDENELRYKLSVGREVLDFHTALQSLRLSNPDALSVFQLNLSENSCTVVKGISSRIIGLSAAETADGMFLNVRRQMPDVRDRKQFKQLFSRKNLAGSFLRGETTVQSDFQLFDATDHIIWCRIKAVLLRDPESESVICVIFAFDVTNIKRNEQVFQIITGKEYDYVALLDVTSGKIEFLNLSDRMTHPYYDKLSLGKPFSFDVLRRFMSHRFVDRCDRAMYLEKTSLVQIKRALNRSGNYELNVRGRIDPKTGMVTCGKIQHYYLDDRKNLILIVQTDVTETYLRQQKEIERAETEAQKANDILDSISGGICVMQMPDADHIRIAYVNKQMYRILGFPLPGSTSGGIAERDSDLIISYLQNALVGVHPDDLERVKKVIHDNFDSQEYVIDNYRARGSGGTYHWLKEDVRLREITPEYRVFYATFRDVSAEVMMQQELAERFAREDELKRAALAANDAKSAFLSQMSHDIRTPLNGIIGMTHIARQQNNSVKTADCLNKIDTSSKFLLGLVNDVLDMAKIESGEVVLHREPYTVREFFLYLDSVIKPLCEAKHQKLRIAGSANRSYLPLLDKLRANQIVFNLLSNAVKYTPEGGTVSLTINEEVTGHRMVISIVVSDTGIGMSSEFQKKLFKSFVQENRSTDSGTVGNSTGLGLAIVKKILDLMGGTISVVSEVGSGSTFTARAPVEFIDAKDYHGTTGKHDCNDCRSRIAGKRILLFEDNYLNQEVTKTILESVGVSVTVAGDGKSGTALFRTAPPGYFDAVLMDIRMPVMDGYEAARQIRSMERTDAALPIIAMTADVYESDIQHCIQNGMNAHVAKPIDPDTLFTVLAELTGNSERQTVDDR